MDANSKLKTAPIMATKNLSVKESVRFSCPVFPSRIGTLPICASETYPPNGSHENRYSVPLCSHENNFGPKPIENRGTCSPRFFAIKKCPSSWTKMDPPKNRIAQNSPHRFNNNDARSMGKICSIHCEFSIRLLHPTALRFCRHPVPRAPKVIE